MPVVPVNFFAILACGVLSMILGSIWYGPLFGNVWMKLSGIKKPEKMTKEIKNSMMRSYSLMFLGSLITAYVLQHALVFAEAYLQASGTSAALMGAFWNWLGFVVPVSIGMVLWEGKPWKLWFLNIGYVLVQLCAMALVLTMWK